MSRFFKDESESEYDQNDQSSEEEEEETDMPDSSILKPILDKIEKELTDFLSSIESESSIDEMKLSVTKLEQTFNEYKNIIQNTKAKLPEKIIEKLISIKQKLFSKSKEEKYTDLFDQYNDKICSKFTDEINKYCQKQNDTDAQKDDDWFVSSDDEEVEQIKKKVRIESRKVKKVNYFTGEIVYENDTEEEKINDSVAKREIDGFIASRQNGQITATTKRLNELLHATTDQKLQQLINNEIALTISQSPVDKAIDNNDWLYALDSISSFSGTPTQLYPLFDRLNKDYWARTIDLRYLFIPSTAQLHELFPKFLELLSDFLNIVKVEDSPEVYIRTADMLNEHIYTDENEQENLLRFSTTILNALSKLNIKDPIFTTAKFGFTPFSYDYENIRNRTCLFLCYNLASTNHPSDAYTLFKRVPYISNNFRYTRVLCNRVRAQIGISAFKQRKYRITYEMLRQFIVAKNIPRNIGQEPKPIFPAWVMLETQKIAYMNLYAAVLLDLPVLAVSTFSTNDNDSQNSIHPKLHRDFLKDPIAHPETPLEKAVATASFAKNGEWKKAFEIAKENIDEEFHANFLNDLKSVSLCSFILNAEEFYESLTFEFLAQMFDMKEDDVKNVFNQMINQKSPIENVPISFKVPKVIDDKYIQFE